jgi:hypothetical protein
VATTPYDIIAGPADVYWAAITSAFPGVDKPDTDATFSGPPWTKLGMTDGGVKAKHTQTVDLLTADQRTGPVKAIRSAEGLEITFNIQELTLANWAVALNNNAVSALTVPSRNVLKMYQGLDVHQFSLLVRGPSPYGSFFLQYQCPVVVQTDEPEASYMRDGKAVLAFKFIALEDPAAATPADRFGSIVAQSA